MKKLNHDFKKPYDTTNDCYDLYEDWDLIEASLAKQYGIRIRTQASMPWTEFCTLVSGLMPDTPLGSIVSIRAEKDRKVIKGFSPEQRRIYNEWRNRNAQKKLDNPDKLSKDFTALENTLKQLFQ
jgi:hypothetical protein